MSTTWRSRILHDHLIVYLQGLEAIGTWDMPNMLSERMLELAIVRKAAGVGSEFVVPRPRYAQAQDLPDGAYFKLSNKSGAGLHGGARRQLDDRRRRRR